MSAPDVTDSPRALPAVACSAGLAVVGMRNLTRREEVKCNAMPSYTRDFQYLQYQTSDGQWHDVPNAFEDATAKTANDPSSATAATKRPD